MNEWKSCIAFVLAFSQCAVCPVFRTSDKFAPHLIWDELSRFFEERDLHRWEAHVSTNHSSCRGVEGEGGTEGILFILYRFSFTTFILINTWQDHLYSLCCARRPSCLLYAYVRGADGGSRVEGVGGGQGVGPTTTITSCSCWGSCCPGCFRWDDLLNISPYVLLQ